MAVQITGPVGPPTDPAVVTGAAVDGGIVCEAAMFEELYFVDLDGKILTDQEAEQLMQVEQETGEMVFSAKYDEWTCTDGSGSFITAESGLLPTSEIDFEGVTDVASWTIDSGTGDYEDLSGTGKVELDLINMTVNYIGELEGA
jgi:hypothetical protein